MLYHLTEGNAQKSLRHIDEVLATFTTVADAFRTVLEQSASDATVTGAA
jgi:flagellin-specific chaperone FliS